MKGWSSLMTSATLVFLLLAVGLALVLFSIKYQVQDLEEELAKVNRQVVAEQRALHVLQAEWSHLTDPERLAWLSDRYLDLEPIDPDQLKSFADVPWPPERGIDAQGRATFRSAGAFIPLVERLDP